MTRLADVRRYYARPVTTEWADLIALWAQVRGGDEGIAEPDLNARWPWQNTNPTEPSLPSRFATTTKGAP